MSGPIITVGEAPDNAGEQIRRERAEAERMFDRNDVEARYHTGGRHSFHSKGISSDSRENPDTLLRPQDTYLEPEGMYSNEQRELELRETPPQEPSREDAAYWRKLYGDSENEKGAMRKLTELYESKIAALESAQQAQPAYTQPQPTTYVPTYEDFARRMPQRFIDKEDTDFVQASDVERLVREHIAPAVWQVSQQAASLAQAQLVAHKHAVGITPQVENQLMRSNPWLQGMPDGLHRINAMQSLMQQAQAANQAAERAQATQPREVQTPQHNYSASQAAARRVTYVEPGRAPSTGHETPSREDLFMREMQQALQQPYGEPRRAAMEKVYNRFGVHRMNDFRDPSILTR